MSQYEKYQKKALAKITQYGGNCEIKRITEKKYNPLTNEYNGEEIVITGKGILSDYEADAVNGTSILSSDVKIMCYLDGEPVIGDVFLFGGKNYNVVNVNALNPDGDCVIYYEMQAR